MADRDHGVSNKVKDPSESWLRKSQEEYRRAIELLYHDRTTIGGIVSRDFTQGYGPEEYLVRRAMNGMYKIETNFYGSSEAQLIGAVTLQVDIFTHYGRPNEKSRSLTLRLTEAKETFLVGQVEF